MSDGMKHRTAVVRDSPIIRNCFHMDVFCLPWKSALICANVVITALLSTDVLAKDASVLAASSYLSCSTSHRGDSGWNNIKMMKKAPGII